MDMIALTTQVPIFASLHGVLGLSPILFPFFHAAPMGAFFTFKLLVLPLFPYKVCTLYFVTTYTKLLKLILATNTKLCQIVHEAIDRWYWEIHPPQHVSLTWHTVLMCPCVAFVCVRESALCMERLMLIIQFLSLCRPSISHQRSSFHQS